MEDALQPIGYSCCCSKLTGLQSYPRSMIFILPEKAYMRFTTSDQYQPCPYLALFSHNTNVTHRRTDGQQTHSARQKLTSKRSLLLVDNVPFHLYG